MKSIAIFVALIGIVSALVISTYDPFGFFDEAEIATDAGPQKPRVRDLTGGRDDDGPTLSERMSGQGQEEPDSKIGQLAPQAPEPEAEEEDYDILTVLQQMLGL